MWSFARNYMNLAWRSDRSWEKGIEQIDPSQEPKMAPLCWTEDDTAYNDYIQTLRRTEFPSLEGAPRLSRHATVCPSYC